MRLLSNLHVKGKPAVLPDRAIRRQSHYFIYRPRTTSCNSQSSATDDGQNYCLKHAELTGIINKPLLLHLVGCLYYLYQQCTVKQISDIEIYLLIKYMKSVLWKVAKRLSYIEDARCLKLNITELKGLEKLFCNGK